MEDLLVSEGSRGGAKSAMGYLEPGGGEQRRSEEARTIGLASGNAVKAGGKAGGGGLGPVKGGKRGGRAVQAWGAVSDAGGEESGGEFSMIGGGWGLDFSRGSGLMGEGEAKPQRDLVRGATVAVMGAERPKLGEGSVPIRRHRTAGGLGQGGLGGVGAGEGRAGGEGGGAVGGGRTAGILPSIGGRKKVWVSGSDFRL